MRCNSRLFFPNPSPFLSVAPFCAGLLCLSYSGFKETPRPCCYTTREYSYRGHTVPLAAAHANCRLARRWTQSVIQAGPLLTRQVGDKSWQFQTLPSRKPRYCSAAKWRNTSQRAVRTQYCVGAVPSPPTLPLCI